MEETQETQVYADGKTCSLAVLIGQLAQGYLPQGAFLPVDSRNTKVGLAKKRTVSAFGARAPMCLQSVASGNERRNPSSLAR